MKKKSKKGEVTLQAAFSKFEKKLWYKRGPGALREMLLQAAVEVWKPTERLLCDKTEVDVIIDNLESSTLFTLSIPGSFIVFIINKCDEEAHVLTLDLEPDAKQCAKLVDAFTEVAGHPLFKLVEVYHDNYVNKVT